jgi:hypothetical protein
VPAPVEHFVVVIRVFDRQLELVCWQVATGDVAKDLFGTKSKGFMILTHEGRAMTVTTAAMCTPGETDVERSALHKSTLAYTGKYRIEGNEFITTVDASWTKIGNGTQQKRCFRLEGDTLYIKSRPLRAKPHLTRSIFAGMSGSETIERQPSPPDNRVRAMLRTSPVRFAPKAA